MVDERLVEAAALGLEDSDGDLHPAVSKAANAFAGYGWKRIFGPDDHARYALLKDLVRAGRRLAVMAAGLEVYVQRRILKSIGAVAPLGILNGVRFGVGAAELAVPSLPQQRAVGTDEHGPDHRIRTHESRPALGEVEARGHPFVVVGFDHGTINLTFVLTRAAGVTIIQMRDGRRNQAKGGPFYFGTWRGCPGSD